MNTLKHPTDRRKGPRCKWCGLQAHPAYVFHGEHYCQRCSRTLRLRDEARSEARTGNQYTQPQ